MHDIQDIDIVPQMICPAWIFCYLCHIQFMDIVIHAYIHAYMAYIHTYVCHVCIYLAKMKKTGEPGRQNDDVGKRFLILCLRHDMIRVLLQVWSNTVLSSDQENAACISSCQHASDMQIFRTQKKKHDRDKQRKFLEPYFNLSFLFLSLGPHSRIITVWAHTS